MGASQPVPTPIAHPPSEASDEALIQRYCACRRTGVKDEAVAQELWRRHGEILKKRIKGIAARPGDVRPDFADYQTFVDGSFSYAWQKYFGGVCGLENPQSAAVLRVWLNRVALTSVLSERRDLLRRTQIDFEPLGDALPDEVPPEEYEEGESSRPRFSSRPDLAERQPSAPSLVAKRERKFIVRELLIRHAGSSDRARESAKFVQLWAWRDWKCPAIAEYRFGPASDPKQKAAREKRVWNHLKGDFARLLTLLQEEFGVSSLREI